MDLTPTLSGPIVIASAAADPSIAAHTGTTADTALVTIPLPAGAMGVSRRLEIETQWSWTGSTNNKIVRHKFDTSTVYSHTQATAANISAVLRSFTTNRNDAAKQISGPVALSGNGGATTAAHITSTINTAIDRNIVISAQLADAGETMTLLAYRIVLWPG